MKISRRALESVADDARQRAPWECCGILLCSRTCCQPVSGDVLSTVNCVIPAENAEKENRERGYVLDHRAHLRAIEMEASGDACIAGYYHSHPDGKARPSHRDVEQAISGVTYLITGMADGRIEHAAWRFEGDELVPEPLEVIDPD